MVEKFWNLTKDINIHIQEVESIMNGINSKKSTLVDKSSQN